MAPASENRQWAGAAPGVCLLLIAATAVVYGRSVGFPFVAYDDEIYVYENPHVASGLSLRGLKWAFTQIHESNWHPLTTLSHMLDCSLYGLWAGGHHLTNVLLHAASSVVLFLALRRMTGAVWRSGMVAALFCLHPLHVESVAWISERKDVLSGLFFGLTLWAYAAYVEGAVGYALVVAMFALGLLTKPILVTLPLVLLLLDYWPLGRWASGASRASLVLEKLPLLAMSAASCVATYMVQQSRGAVNEQAPVFFRLQTALLAYGNYLLKTIVPLNLAASYPLRQSPAPLACLLCFLTLASISAGVILLARRDGGSAAVGWLWFLGMIVPVSGIVMIGDQSMADRYTYLSLTGIFIAVVFSCCRVRGAGSSAGKGALREAAEKLDEAASGVQVPCATHRPATASLHGPYACVGPAAFAVVLSLSSVLSFLQVAYWRDSEALWRHVLAVAYDNALAHSNLAAVLHDRGPEGKAEADFHLAEALRIRPGDALANNNFGIALAEKGDWEGAMRHYRIAVNSRPSFAPAHLNLGVALCSLKRAVEAEAELREALRLDPDYAKADNCLGDALAMQGRWSDAVAHYRRAIERDPYVPRYHVDLGAALVKFGAAQGNKELISEGIEDCRRGVAMKPDDADAHSELATAYNTAGMTQDAAGQWRDTLKLRPDHPVALKEVGAMLVKSRRPAEALKFLTAAEAAAPRDVEVRRMKVLAHALMRQVPAAIAECREVLKLDANDFNAMTTIAWFEATSPDKSVRNGREAIELAQRAVALQHPPTPHALDVLAAAYAEAGRFKDAVETAQKAKRAAAALGNQKPLDGIDARIKLYQAGEPYRDKTIAP